MTFDQFIHGTLKRPYRLYYRRHVSSSRAGRKTTVTQSESDKPVIIMLHGIAASSDDWSPLLPLLAADYDCITIDLLGFAKSPKPQWARYDMTDHLRSIEHTINHIRRDLRLKRPFILAGHSLGSLLATRYARTRPQNVSRLLLLSPPVYPRLEFDDKRAMRRTNLLINTYKFLRTHPRMTPENIRRLSRIIPLPRSIVLQPATWKPFFRTLEHCIEQQTIIEDIKRVSLPIDVFYGSLDSVVVGANVRRLAGSNINLHAFRGNHTIGQRYARTVAASLNVAIPSKR